MTVQAKPSDAQSIPRMLTRRQRLCRNAVLRYLARIEENRLIVEVPGEEPHLFGPPDDTPAILQIHHPQFFTRLASSGDIGFGESFMHGEWSSPDLVHLLSTLAHRDARMQSRSIFRWSSLFQTLNRMRHVLRPNSIGGSRRNIAAHYDLSNEFFELFLDPLMMYSSAIYDSDGQSLADAQRARVRQIIETARIGPDHHLLEIGSGWGGFALEAARQSGCRITSITLSGEQLRYARERARREGLDEKVKFQLCDYREARGSYDRIISIEMLEAVGHRHLGSFFSACDQLLNPNGLVFLQVITIPDQRYRQYRRSCDWIQKHIFPGGMLPSLHALSASISGHSALQIEGVRSIGAHYARTLHDWRISFQARLTEARALGFDDIFIRKWIYYLSYCEAGFSAKLIDDLHITLARPGEHISAICEDC